MIIPTIIAGGSGSRLWPVSRSLYPKQFLALQSEKLSMLQQTLMRIKDLDCQLPITICSEEHRFIVAEQLNQINQLGSIILEPAGRNTAPAIALAAHSVAKNDPLLLVLPADHLIQEPEKFIEAINKAIPLANSGEMVTFGVVPQHAHTGYGYIKQGSAIEQGFTVETFVEKPDKTTAQQYLESGNYYWNSGIFLFKASKYISELKKYRPDINNACSQALVDSSIDSDKDFIRINKQIFLDCPSESIDYAVMESTSNAVVVPLDAGWSDVGSWSALWDVSEKDDQGNATYGDTIQIDSKDCFIRSESRLVATIGLENMAVIETKDAVLVAHQDKVQDVKAIVAKLKEASRSEHILHREVYRPWGKYESIDNGTRYQVKHIMVKPGEKLSLQMHHHRAEHWIVVSGTAKVTNGDKTFLVTENESTYIPVGTVHALENPGKVPLEMIEVQSGSYLKEDDIVRFEDRYGRL
ncbi:mannose-1-phosphate guanylyltransferase/mannose-6-phosphate isomerase [Vibrio salinus]|uniref:mannose-1-phosphate guanylyltransferase/mannose-6-phosphate isomerase n=1 Tax=Vibrio salinus TaxID=2899784 RepID=UPI001EE57162|nr:mannose-1-phosphate guanylyltransferase/mannose-6-phosphate isomerase [Vibrio salinus]